MSAPTRPRTGGRRRRTRSRPTFYIRYKDLKSAAAAGENQPPKPLEKQEYIRLRDAKSGNLRQVHGPATVVPFPHETVTSREPQRAVKLSDLEYVIVTDTLSGAERLVSGPALFFPQSAYERVGEALQKRPLSELEYTVVTDTLSGSKRVVQGPALYAPASPHELIGDTSHAFELKQHQYVKLLDSATGRVRVMRGEAVIFPAAHEVPAEGNPAVRNAVNVDDETAVLVLSLQTGQQRLVTDQAHLHAQS